MPKKALRPCRYPGCPQLVEQGYCDAHAAIAAEMRRGAVVRDPEVQKLYNLRIWRKMRKRQLSMQSWCEECLKEGRYTPAEHVHHVGRHQGDMDKFLNSPLMSLCHSCHSRITIQEMKGRGAEKVS